MVQCSHFDYYNSSILFIYLISCLCHLYLMIHLEIVGRLSLGSSVSQNPLCLFYTSLACTRYLYFSLSLFTCICINVYIFSTKRVKVHVHEKTTYLLFNSWHLASIQLSIFQLQIRLKSRDKCLVTNLNKIEKLSMFSSPQSSSYPRLFLYLSFKFLLIQVSIIADKTMFEYYLNKFLETKLSIPDGCI